MIRLFLLKFFIPVYEFISRRYVGIFLSVKVRNSILSAQDYSPLLSDLDLAAVGEFSENDAKNLRGFHEKLKKILLFLGELEIYSLLEWEAKKSLLQKLEPHYTSLRHLRKIPWMVRLTENSHFLAGLRAKRGLARSLEKLGMNSLGGLENVIEELGSKMAREWKIELTEGEQAFEFYHPWLEVTLTDSHKSAYLLAAIFPPRAYRGADQKKIDSLRREKPIKDFLLTFARHELIVMTAGTRGFDEMPPWYLSNLPDLKHWSLQGDA